MSKRLRSSAEGAKLLGADGDNDENKLHRPGDILEKRKHILQLVLFLVVVIVLHLMSKGDLDPSSLGSSQSTHSMPADALTFELDQKIKVRVAFTSENNSILLGSHQVALEVDPKCSDPRVWLRLEGDALAPIILTQESKTFWFGEFNVPKPGQFELVAHSFGCDGLSKKEVSKIYPFTANGIHGFSGHSESNPIFPKAYWIPSELFPQANEPKQPYIFHDPSVPYPSATLFKTENSVTSKSGVTTKEHDFFQFNKLSNYELVCWFGSDSAQQIRGAFLQQRDMASKGQKPFKFHMYPADHLVNPARDWNEENQKRFRKCKHILVSFDDIPDNLSQKECQTQIETLLKHLQTAFPDQTFPIWMFTVNEAPSRATNCHSPFLPRTSDHPCNDALRDLFSKKTLQSRVQLMDNTDISLPQLGENALDVFSVIALRIFVIVGKRVQEWREAGQVGHVNGLTRGDKEEPNFELVPYTGWNK